MRGMRQGIPTKGPFDQTSANSQTNRARLDAIDSRVWVHVRVSMCVCALVCVPAMVILATASGFPANSGCR